MFNFFGFFVYHLLVSMTASSQACSLACSKACLWQPVESTLQMKYTKCWKLPMQLMHDSFFSSSCSQHQMTLPPCDL